MNPMILRNLSYGMYAIGVKGKERPSACIVNTVVQITSENPPIIAVSMNHYNYSHQCIEENGIFTVSVLSEDTSGTVIGTLGFNSGKDVDKLQASTFGNRAFFTVTITMLLKVLHLKMHLRISLLK